MLKMNIYLNTYTKRRNQQIWLPINFFVVVDPGTIEETGVSEMQDVRNRKIYL